MDGLGMGSLRISASAELAGGWFLRALDIRHGPDDVTDRLQALASRAGLPLNPITHQAPTEAAPRTDNGALLSSLPSSSIDRASILEVLQQIRRDS